MGKVVVPLTDGGSATTAPPSSGSGIIGWLRGIYDRLSSVAAPNVVVYETVANVAASGTATSGWIDLLPYAGVSVGIRTSHASATDGLEIAYSLDGVTQDDNDLYTIPAANGQQLKFGQGFRYGRVNYTNGGTLTTTFRLQVIAHSTVQKSSTHRVADTVNNQQDTDLITAILKAIDSVTGLGTNVTAYSVGALVAPTVLPIDAAGGVPIFTNGLKVRDDYQLGQCITEVAGSGAVQGFNFSQPVDFVWVTDVAPSATGSANVTRVDPYGGTPSATKGFPVFNQSITPIPVIPAASTVNVFAPTTAVINMVGFRRTSA